MASLQQLLAPQVLTRVISQTAAASNWILNLFGVQPGGPNVLNYGHGREGAFHIYNHIRKVAKGRAPGMPAGRRAPNPMAKIQFTYPRMHDSVSLLSELMHNLARIDNPAIRDAAGADMIRRQTDTLGEMAGNWRKAQLMGMFRDSLYLASSGDDEYLNFSSGVQIPFNMPSGNKAQLNMLGAGSIIDTTWSNTSAANIPKHLGLINAAFQRLCGGNLAACICGTAVWQNVINNAFVAAIHGSAHSPFIVLERDSLDPMLGNTSLNVYRARLNVYPDIIWYITDEGLDIGAPGSETFTKLVDDKNVLFIGSNPGTDAVAVYEGSEPIAEYDGGPEVVKTGLASWAVKRSNPTQTDIFVLDNSLVVNHVPASLAYGQVVFP